MQCLGAGEDFGGVPCHHRHPLFLMVASIFSHSLCDVKFFSLTPADSRSNRAVPGRTRRFQALGEVSGSHLPLTTVLFVPTPGLRPATLVDSG